MALKLAAQPKHLGHIGHGKAGHLSAPVATERDQPLAGQPRQRFTHRRAADANPLGQARFEQNFTRSQFAADDGTTDVPVSNVDRTIAVAVRGCRLFRCRHASLLQAIRCACTQRFDAFVFILGDFWPVYRLPRRRTQHGSLTTHSLTSAKELAVKTHSRSFT